MIMIMISLIINDFNIYVVYMNIIIINHLRNNYFGYNYYGYDYYID
jgi:hypothetical protein